MFDPSIPLWWKAVCLLLFVLFMVLYYRYFRELSPEEIEEEEWKGKGGEGEPLDWLSD